MEENFEEYRRNNSSNGLGIAGFVLSLIFCTAFLGLPLSLIALKRQPRGFAIAGTVLGVIFLIIQASVIFMAVRGVQESGWETVGNAWEGYRDGNQIGIASQQYYQKNGKYVTKISDLGLAEDVTTDPWGHKYRLAYMKSPFDDSYLPLVLSPGRDGIFDNDDDPTQMGEGTLIDPADVNSLGKENPEEENPEKDEETGGEKK